MSKLEGRLDQLLRDMSPEDKARYFIQGPLLGHEVSDLEQCQLIDRMKPEEGRRYNAFLQRWHRLRRNLGMLLTMASEVKDKLLSRDRILWYWRGVLDVEQALVFSHGPALLQENLNVKPGKPLEIHTLVGVVRLGVLGKDRLPFGRRLGAEVSEKMQEILGLYAQMVRQRASECKALAAYVEEEAEAMEMGTVKPLIHWALRELKEYDRPLLREVVSGAREGIPEGAIYPVEERWALVWEDVEEDPETSRRVREDPTNWESMEVDRLLAGRSQGEFWQVVTSQMD